MEDFEKQSLRDSKDRSEAETEGRTERTDPCPEILPPTPFLRETGGGGKRILLRIRRDWRFPALLMLCAVCMLALLFGALLSERRGGDPGSETSFALSGSSLLPESVPGEEESVSADDPDISETEENSGEDFPHGWVINDRGYTYLYGNLAVEQFNFSDATFSRYVESVCGIAEQVRDGTSVFCMPIPTRIGFLYSEIANEIKRQDDFFNSSEEVFLRRLQEALPRRITTIGLFGTFAEEYGNGGELFFRTDRNWTSYAAFLAYESFCRASGIAPTALTVYSEKRIDGFLGSFYAATNASSLEREPEAFRYYGNEDTDRCTVTLYGDEGMLGRFRLTGNGYTDPADAYRTYLGADGPYFVIESPCPSDRKLLIVGDGSAAAMIPFLIENYSEIHYINATGYHGTLASVFRENSFRDVLIVSYLTNAVKGDFPVWLETMAGTEPG